MHHSVTLLWAFPTSDMRHLVHFWHKKERKKNASHFALRQCFFRFLRARDGTLIHPSLPPSLSFLTASCGGGGDGEERSDRGSKCEGELKMTDNRGEVKEPQRGCGSGRRGGAALQRYTETPPASTSSPPFLLSSSLPSAPISSSLPSSSLPWMICVHANGGIMYASFRSLRKRAAQHLGRRKWSGYTTWKCLHPVTVAYLCQCCSIRAGRVKTKTHFLPTTWPEKEQPESHLRGVT